MAISNRSRIGRRRGGRFKRRFRRKIKFKRRFRRKGSLNKRILRVSARKKHDTLLGGPAPLPLTIGSQYVLWSPTYSPAATAVGSTDYRREAQKTFFRGISERIMISTKEHITWRRVLFYSYEQLGSGLPIFSTNPTTGNKYMQRPLQTFDPETGGAHEATGDLLWAGTEGFDYSESTRPFHRLDSNHVKVIYDKQMDIAPNYDMSANDAGHVHGKQITRKLWHPINRSLTYDTKEEGDDKGNFSGWVTTAPMSPGNVYILDIFTTGQGAVADPPQIGIFRTEATIYWHEH